MMNIVIALAVAAATAAASSAIADPRVHHGAKHQRSHHLHARPATPGQPLFLAPTEHYGGPRYSTCDRINADRMLVGTCR